MIPQFIQLIRFSFIRTLANRICFRFIKNNNLRSDQSIWFPCLLLVAFEASRDRKRERQSEREKLILISFVSVGSAQTKIENNNSRNVWQNRWLCNVCAPIYAKRSSVVSSVDVMQCIWLEMLQLTSLSLSLPNSNSTIYFDSEMYAAYTAHVRWNSVLRNFVHISGNTHTVHAPCIFCSTLLR